MGSCPKSVIDDKRLRGNELWLDGLLSAAPQKRVIGRLRETQSCRDACGSGLQGRVPCGRIGLWADRYS
jgi:hypothetical protein